MKVFVSGATGVAGSAAVPALIAAGHEVTAVARSEAKAELLRGWGAQPAKVDLFDPAAVRHALDGHDAVCNLATHIPPFTKAMSRKAWRENDRIRTEVSRNLVDAALASDVQRFVQESIAFVYPDCGDSWIDEGVEPAGGSVTESALVAEGHAARFTAGGRSGVVLRFALFYGPDSDQSVLMLRLAKRFRLAPTIGSPDAFHPSIYQSDIGTAVVAALDAPAGTYNVGDDEPLRQTDFAAAIAAAAGRRKLIDTGRLTARLGGKHVEPVSRSLRLSHDAFTRATGWQPRVRSAREGWATIASELGP